MSALAMPLCSLTVAYQPIFDLHTGRVFGHEALGRVRDGALGPAALLDIAHRDGSLLDLDRAWRRLAIAGAAREVRRSDARLFLNVDSRALDDPAFRAGFTLAAAQEAGVSPERIVLEITERSPGLSMDRVAAVVAHYAEQGFAVALDDVGSGYASLTAVLRLRPSVIKLDGELVHGIAADRLRRHLVAALVGFAERSDITLVAEGIETREDLRAVTRAGVRLGQGWLLQPPMPAPMPGPIDLAFLLSPAAPTPPARVLPAAAEILLQEARACWRES